MRRSVSTPARLLAPVTLRVLVTPLALAALAVSVALSGCSGTDTPSPGSGEAGETSEPTTLEEPTSAVEPAEFDALRIPALEAARAWRDDAYLVSADGIDPHQADGPSWRLYFGSETDEGRFDVFFDPSGAIVETKAWDAETVAAYFANAGRQEIPQAIIDWPLAWELCVAETERYTPVAETTDSTLSIGLEPLTNTVTWHSKVFDVEHSAYVQVALDPVAGDVLEVLVPWE
jgi:hypothetical protein